MKTNFSARCSFGLVKGCVSAVAPCGLGPGSALIAPVTLDIDSHERKIVRVETALILLTIAAIAVADAWVGPGRSLGPLYLVPLSYSALTHRGWTTLVLLLLCLFLRQLFGPLQDSEDPWLFFVRDLGIAAVFVVTVGYLHRLGRQRQEFFALARAQRDELAGELNVAAEVQRRLLQSNQSARAELDFHAWAEPLKGVGGDYYDVWTTEEGRAVVVVADVAGKGLPAALLMPALRIAVRSIAARLQDPARIIEEVNEALCQTTEPSSYATLFYASLDMEDGSLTYVNAGHLPGLLVDGAGEVRWLTGGGTPVGLVPEAPYESRTLQLGTDDLLVLYTDGIWEAENPGGEEFGRERLARAVVATRERPAGEIVAAVQDEWNRFRDGADHGDDTTLIALKKAPARDPKPGAAA
jgi:serine phosphatase RsbU (regulator of sigma subunit)